MMANFGTVGPTYHNIVICSGLAGRHSRLVVVVVLES